MGRDTLKRSGVWKSLLLLLVRSKYEQDSGEIGAVGKAGLYSQNTSRK
jgi:hypothetical protein